MEQAISHSSSRLNHVSFQRKERYKTAVYTEIAVKNPLTDGLDTQTVVTYKEEPVIDEHLKASDFDIEVQIRNGVNLKDCGCYLEPSTPEEYMSVISNVSSWISQAQASQVPEPVSPSEPNVEPQKTE